MGLVSANWNPTARQLRRFGVAALVGFGLLSALLVSAFGRAEAAFACIGVGAAVGLLALSNTWPARPLYLAWTALGFVLGSVVTCVMLVTAFYGVLAPMGLLMRLGGRDRLSLRRRALPTYWRDLPPPADLARYERQF